MLSVQPARSAPVSRRGHVGLCRIRSTAWRYSPRRYSHDGGAWPDTRAVKPPDPARLFRPLAPRQRLATPRVRPRGSSTWPVRAVHCRDAGSIPAPSGSMDNEGPPQRPAEPGSAFVRVHTRALAATEEIICATQPTRADPGVASRRRSHSCRTGEQLTRLVNRRDAPAERADEIGGVGHELGIRRSEHTAA